MIKKYIYRRVYGVGKNQFSLMLDEDHMPICFDTVQDWAMEQLKPQHKNWCWKLVHEEKVDA